MELRKIIEKTIEKYNKYISPESIAKLVSLSRNSFKIEFTGTFCQTCGFYDYFEDFKYMMEEGGVKVEIEKIEETGNGAIVLFGIV